MSEVQVENKTGIFKIAVNLAVTCLISGAILAGAYYLTHPIAVEKAKMLRDLSMKSLVPDAETFVQVEGDEDMYQAKTGEQVVAYVVSVEPKGYGGAIRMLVAVTPDGAVIDYSISSMNETPGLGSKAGEEPFKSQFAGKTSGDLIVTKDTDDTSKVQAITGATISSRAVTKGVKEAVDAVTALEGGNGQ